MADKILLLIADDEPMIVMTVSEALEQGGYQVVSASTGAEASALLNERTRKFVVSSPTLGLAQSPMGGSSRATRGRLTLTCRSST